MERVIHIRTQYLGPDELLVAAKMRWCPASTPREVARPSTRPRPGCAPKVPAARLIYLEPDLDRTLARRLSGSRRGVTSLTR